VALSLIAAYVSNMTTIRELVHFSHLYIVVAFLIGLLFGSFLNVCITRLPKHESIIYPRSRCPHCGHAIRGYDNIPLFSFFVLRARCRDCTKKIPWRYPAVEVAFALWLAVLVWRWFTIPSFFTGIFALVSYAMERDITTRVWVGEGMSVLVPAILGFLLIGLMVMDWQTQRLPDAFTLSGIAIGSLLTCVQALYLPAGQGDIKIDTTHQLRMSSPGSFASQGNVFMTGTEAMIWGRILAICGAALLLFTISAIYKAARKRDGMGMGDIKLLAMIAAFLGFGESLFALFVGVIAAAVYAIILLARRRANATTRLPFGSFLAAGGIFAALFGPRIVDWYTNLLR
jgi:leader peptidase (prepilin peptidase) / N-methyltransferase